MKIQFRIAKKNDRYYPHVRVKGFLFWDKWKRIGEHVDGFGLYDDLYRHGNQIESDSLRLIDKFVNWKAKEKNPPEFKPVKLGINKP